jgi:hypothetical protein
MDKWHDKEVIVINVGQRWVDFSMPITACKEALEQPANKNIRDSFNEMLEDKVAYYKGKHPAQEPVAYLKEVGGYGIIDFAHFDEDGAYPVYTHPHQWQGLTDDEICDLWTLSDKDIDGIDLGYTTQQHYFAALVEQALKEKNNG